MKSEGINVPRGRNVHENPSIYWNFPILYSYKNVFKSYNMTLLTLSWSLLINPFLPLRSGDAGKRVMETAMQMSQHDTSVHSLPHNEELDDKTLQKLVIVNEKWKG